VALAASRRRRFQQADGSCGVPGSDSTDRRVDEGMNESNTESGKRYGALEGDGRLAIA